MGYIFRLANYLTILFKQLSEHALFYVIINECVTKKRK